jgi:hypothetical protein
MKNDTNEKVSVFHLDVRNVKVTKVIGSNEIEWEFEYRLTYRGKWRNATIRGTRAEKAFGEFFWFQYTHWLVNELEHGRNV